jgi:hypothetical protein
MSKNIAVISAAGVVVNVKVCADDYEPEPHEVEVAGTAWIGGDFVDGVFYPPQPFASWIRQDGEWIPPVTKPEDDNRYVWNEHEQKWEQVV